jgi:hypothetical protein
MNSAQQIIAHIDGYMKSFPRTKNADWYVGIASDVRQRLFGDHGVSEDSGAWAWMGAASAEVARSVEAIYHAAGCDGGPGGGDHTTTVVYAYLKCAQTDP